MLGTGWPSPCHAEGDYHAEGREVGIVSTVVFYERQTVPPSTNAWLGAAAVVLQNGVLAAAGVERTEVLISSFVVLPPQTGRFQQVSTPQSEQEQNE